MNENRKRFVFIAHYIEPWNWLLNHFGFLHREPRWRFLFLPLYPVFWLISLFYGLGNKPFNQVDRFLVNDDLEGYTLLIRNFAWHFAAPWWRERIKKRILQAALFAQNELGARVVGLGALTKAEWLTQGGEWLAGQPGIKIPVVHGDTATAWFVAAQAEDLCQRFNVRTPIFVVGATSKIGRALALELTRRGHSLYLYSKDWDRARKIIAEIPPGKQCLLSWTGNLADGKRCGLWIIGKAKPGGRILRRAIPRQAVVLNFSVPDPLTFFWLYRRPDLRHFDGGLVNFNHHCGMRFMMRLKPDFTYACAVGTMVHALNGWTHHETGQIEIDKLQAVGAASQNLGFRLPPYTSHLREKDVPPFPLE